MQSSCAGLFESGRLIARTHLECGGLSPQFVVCCLHNPHTNSEVCDSCPGADIAVQLLGRQQSLRPMLWSTYLQIVAVVIQALIIQIRLSLSQNFDIPKLVLRESDFQLSDNVHQVFLPALAASQRF